MNALEGLLQAIASDPRSEDRWQVLADYLEDHDDPGRAELLRLHRKMLATCCESDHRPERLVWHARMVELIGEGVRPCVPQTTLALGQGVEMKLSLVPPGSFLMGSPKGEAGKNSAAVQRRGTLTRGFYLGVSLVTQAQWKAVMGSNPSKFEDDDLPVERVSWDDCSEFCQVLGEQTDKSFRLPTEAEWEYACRAGTTTAYYTGEGLEAMMRAGWCNHDGTWGTGRRTLPGYLDYGEGAKSKSVGLFDSNAWGLYDLHGNVWEWCQDWYASRLLSVAAIDPPGPPGGTQRVLRGGCFFNEPAFCRSASRYGFEPDWRVETVGCRVCMNLD